MHKVMLVTRLCRCLSVSVPVSCTVNRRQGADGWCSIRYYVGSTIGESTCNMHGQPKSGHNKELGMETLKATALSLDLPPIIEHELSFPIPVCLLIHFVNVPSCLG